jgi:hypothetical protein
MPDTVLAVPRKIDVFNMLFLNGRGKTRSRLDTLSLWRSSGVRRVFSKASSAKAREVIYASG